MAPEVTGLADIVAQSLQPEEQATPQSSSNVANQSAARIPEITVDPAPGVQNFTNNVAQSFFTSPAISGNLSIPQQSSAKSSNSRAGTFVTNQNPSQSAQENSQTEPQETSPMKNQSEEQSGTPIRYGDYENRRTDFDTPKSLQAPEEVFYDAKSPEESFIRGDILQAEIEKNSQASSQVVQPRASEPQTSSRHNAFQTGQSPRFSAPTQSPAVSEPISSQQRNLGTDQYSSPGRSEPANNDLHENPRLSHPMTVSGLTSMRSSHGNTDALSNLENAALYQSMAKASENSDGTTYHTPESSIASRSAPQSPLTEKSVSLGSHTTPRQTQYDTAAELPMESQPDDLSQSSIALQPVQMSQNATPQKMSTIDENCEFGV